MRYRSSSGVVLSIVVIAVVAPLIAASQWGQSDEPWPALLSSQRASIEPGYALLQDRANASLERLLRSDSVPE